MDVLATWTPIGIAGLALAVSTVALVLQFRHHPRPRLHLDWSEWVSMGNVESGVLFGWVTLTNAGTAPARGVRVYASTLQEFAIEEIPVFEAGETIEIRVPLNEVNLAAGDYGAWYRPKSGMTWEPVRVTVRVRAAGFRRMLTKRSPKLPITRNGYLLLR
jgi:hypothetical protein